VVIVVVVEEDILAKTSFFSLHLFVI
jgi:hypothetical protein